MFGHLVQTKGIEPRLLNGLIEGESGLLLGSIALRMVVRWLRLRPLSVTAWPFCRHAGACNHLYNVVLALTTGAQ